MTCPAKLGDTYLMMLNYLTSTWWCCTRQYLLYDVALGNTYFMMLHKVVPTWWCWTRWYVPDGVKLGNTYLMILWNLPDIELADTYLIVLS